LAHEFARSEQASFSEFIQRCAREILLLALDNELMWFILKLFALPLVPDRYYIAKLTVNMVIIAVSNETGYVCFVLRRMRARRYDRDDNIFD
jgi:hypothetical protein